MAPRRPRALLRGAARRLALHGLGVVRRPLVEDSSDDPFHETFRLFVERVNARPGARVLELGARGSQPDPRLRGLSLYTGVDIHPGPNVSLVADAHELSRHVDEPYDAIYAISTFEHLAMPWLAVLELNRCLVPGGLLFVATHPTWPPHAQPWDFWRFSAAAFDALLNPATGFRIVRASEGLPCLIVPINTERSTRGIHTQRAFMGVSVLAEKTSASVPGLAWPVAVEDVVATSYPERLGEG